MIPSRQQWRGWSLPSKLTAIGAYVGIAAFALGLITMVINWRSSDEEAPQEPQKAPASEQAGQTKPGTEEYLSDEALRGRIDGYLRLEQIRSAVALLGKIDDLDAKAEECNRIFSFSLRRRLLDVAEDMVDDCWKGDKKKEALEAVAHERLKQ